MCVLVWMSSLYNSAMFGTWINHHARVLVDSSGDRVPPNAQLLDCATRQAPHALGRLRAAVQASVATTAEVSAYSFLPPTTAAPSPSPSTGPATPPQALAGTQPCFGCTTVFVESLLAHLQTVSEHSRKVREELVAAGLLEELYEHNIRAGARDARAGAMKLVYRLCETSVPASERIAALLVRRVRGVVDAALASPGTAPSAAAALAPDMDLLDLLAQPSGARRAFCPWAVRVRAVFRLVDHFCDITRSGAVVPQCVLQFILAPLLFTLGNAVNETFSVIEEPDACFTFAEMAKTLMLATAASTGEECGFGNSEEEEEEEEEEEGGYGDEEMEEEREEDEYDDDDEYRDADHSCEFPPEFGLFLTGRLPLMDKEEEEESSEMCDDGDDVDDDDDEEEEEEGEKMSKEEVRKEAAVWCRSYMLSRYVRLWKTREGQTKPTVECLSDLLSEQVFRAFLLCPQCELVRIAFSALLSLFAQTDRQAVLCVLDVLVPLLRDVVATSPEVTSQYYSLLRVLVRDQSTRCYAEVRHHLTQRLLDAIGDTSQRMARAENAGRPLGDPTFGADVWVPQQVLLGMLGVESIRVRFATGAHMSALLSAFITARSVVVNANVYTAKAAASFWNLLLVLQQDNPDSTAFMRAYVSVMGTLTTASPRAAAFLMDQMIHMIEPEKVEVEYFLELQKIRSQAEYFAGNMDHNPYSSREIGATMRDVKRKICTALNMPGVLEDDNGLELLVDGNIVNLNLPIRLVYEKVWLPNHPLAGRLGDRRAMLANPMRVIFRLQGLDGEATEPMIDTIPEDVVVEDTAARDRLVAVILECGGQNAFLDVLRSAPAQHTLPSRALIAAAFKLLELCCTNAAGRRLVLDAGGLAVVVRILRNVLQALAALDPAAKAQCGQLEHLFAAGLAVAGPLVHEATQAATAATAATDDVLARVYGPDISAGEETMRAMIAAMATPAICANAAVHEGLCRLVPALTFGSPVLSGCVARFVAEHLSAAVLAQIDERNVPAASLASKGVSAVAAIVHWSPPALKTFLVTDSLQLHRMLCSHLLGVYGLIAGRMSDSSDSSDSNGSVLEAMFAVPSVPVVLQILVSLVTGHAESQRALLGCGDIVPLLHRMEECHADKTGVGLLAESVLDAMHDSAEAKAAVDDIRNAERREKEALASRRRAELLKKMGMKQDGHKILMSAAAAAFGVPEDETGLACLVCQEGYTFKPDDVLGAYVYHYRCPMHSFLLTRAPTPSGECDGAMTITAFNVIHLDCHAAATRAERAKKHPLAEWDAALVRNQMVHCNAILPLDGPALPHARYGEAASHYVLGLLQARGGPGTRARAVTVLVHDLMFSLMRLAYEGSDVFDTQQLLEVHARQITAGSGGSGSSSSKRPTSVELGGRESTLQLCPWVVALAADLVAAGVCPLDPARVFADFLAVAPAEWARHGERADNPPYFLAFALAFVPLMQWDDAKPAVLRAVLGYAYAEGRACRRADAAAMQALDVAGVFRTCQPALVTLLLVDRMQAVLKRALPPCDAPDAAWLRLLCRRVVEQGRACSDAFGQLYAELDDMKACADFQEVFDALGVLGAVHDAQKTAPPPAQTVADAFVLDLWKSFA